MLVLGRKKTQSIVIGGNVEVFVVDIRGDTVRLGVDAPDSIRVDRREIHNLRQRAKAGEKRK